MLIMDILLLCLLNDLTIIGRLWKILSWNNDTNYYNVIYII